jgi:hypothetical protein
MIFTFPSSQNTERRYVSQIASGVTKVCGDQDLAAFQIPRMKLLVPD